MQTELEIFLNKCEKSKVQAYVHAHPDCVNEALQLISGGESPVSWRAAWLIELHMKQNDSRIQPHIEELIRILPSRAESEQREIMKILYKMDVDENIEGLLFDHCASIWLTLNKQTSVRVNALKLICKIAMRQPEMMDELKVLTQSHYLEKMSLPIRNSIGRMISGVSKKNKT